MSGKKSLNIKRTIVFRAWIATGFIVVFALAIAARLVYVQFYHTYKGKKWRDRITEFRIKRDTLQAGRGSIYSSDGSLLATSLPYYYVGIDPRVAKEDYFDAKIDSLAMLLSRRFGDRSRQEYVDLIRSARNNKRKYVLLSRTKVTFQDRLAMLQWPFFRRESKNRGGGKFDAVYQRYNPYGKMALRTVGYMNAKTNRGLVGLEASFQEELGGKDGVGLVEDLSGGVKMPIEDGSDVKPESGMDIYTTIDVNFQDMAESALKQGLEAYQADKGCVIVMDVATGEIRAMANLSHYRGEYVETFNHALAGRTDPGSTFKLASMMALLEEKAVRLDQTVATGGGTTLYRGMRITDAKRGGYGTITAREVFEKSSNVGVHMLMRNYYYARPELFLRYLNQFRLTKPTGFHMHGEAKPVVHNPQMKGWSKLSMPSMAVGYELQITPLQMLTFYNAVANNGKWVRPMIVRQIRRSGEVVKEFAPHVEPEPICSPQTARQARMMLEGVVEHGTARKIRSNYYKIAGKTGTAQKLINGQYQVGRYYTTFIGYFPADRPKYSMLVMVDSPRGNNIDLLMGGAVAAPIFREVADRIFAYDIRMHPPVATTTRPKSPENGVKAGFADDLRTISAELNIDSQPSADGWVKAQAQGSRMRWVNQSANRDRVPDVRGMTLRDALHLLENRGFAVRFQGIGKVTEQSLEPGRPLPSPRRITLMLRQTNPRPDTLKLPQEPVERRTAFTPAAANGRKPSRQP